MDLAISNPSGAMDFTIGRPRELMHVFFDRHLPLTPALARDLAELEINPAPASQIIWGKAYHLAGCAIGQERGLGHTNAWTRIFDDFCRIVAEPLLRKAARDLGLVHILGTADVPDPRRSKHVAGFSVYCQRLDNIVAGCLADPEVMPGGFWSHAGTALLASYFARIERLRSSGRSHQVIALPSRSDPLFSRLIFDVAPDFGDAQRLRRFRHRVRQKAERQRSGFRPREGGVAGVVHSRRFEDLHDALPSTFALPPEYLPLKVMEEGFPITHRPPHRQTARDLLWQTFNSAGISAGPAAVVKAAWVDAVLRLRFLLSDAKRTRSEIGWCDIDGDRLLPASTSVFQTGRRAAINPFQIEEATRRKLISRSHLFPDCAATLPSRASLILTERLRRPGQKITELAGQVLQEHLRLAALQREFSAAKEMTGEMTGSQEPRNRRFSVADYAVVFLTHVESAALDRVSADAMVWHEVEGRIRRRFPVPHARRLVILSVQVPPELGGRDKAIVLTSGRTPEGTKVFLDPDQPPDQELAKLIGTLSLKFATEALEAIYGG